MINSQKLGMMGHALQTRTCTYILSPMLFLSDDFWSSRGPRIAIATAPAGAVKIMDRTAIVKTYRKVEGKKRREITQQFIIQHRIPWPPASCSMYIWHQSAIMHMYLCTMGYIHICSKCPDCSLFSDSNAPRILSNYSIFSDCCVLSDPCDYSVPSDLRDCSVPTDYNVSWRL